MKLRLLLLSFFTIIVIGSVSAQTDKGSHYIGGSLYYNYDGGPGTSTVYNYPAGTTVYTISNLTTFQISPEIGYFFAKNWAVGIQPNYSYSSGTETNNFTSTTTGVNSFISTDHYHTNVIGLTLSLRYYYMLTDKIGIFPQFGVSSQNDVKDFGNGELTLLASPNIVFFATPKLGINLGFGNAKYATDYHFNYNYVNIGFNNTISFGLNYYCGGK